jgi:predicted Zn-dependent protease
MKSESTETTQDVSLKVMHASMLLDRDAAAAARAAAAILSEHPGNPAACLLLATASRNLGDAAKALELLSDLGNAQPKSAVIQLELARARRAAGDKGQAITALQRAVEIEPGLAEAWRELAKELAARGDELDADKAYARYAALAPPEPWLLEPAGAIAENRLAVADTLLRRRRKEFPDDTGALRMLAEVARRREGYREAERLLRECLELEPGYAAARYDLAQLLLTQQQPAQVAALIQRLLRSDPENPTYLGLQASYSSFVGQHDRSITILEKFLAAPPGRAATWLQYGHELKAAGRQVDSIAAYRNSIALAPSSGAAYWSLANLKTFRFPATDIEAMRAALQRPDLRFDERIGFEFALAKALEDASQYVESFEHYAQGNSLRQTAGKYDADKTTSHVARSREIFTREFFTARTGWGSDAADPIFIVGLPRSGSTLLEQILASHSQVEGTRELADIMNLARELGAANNGELDPSAYLHSVASLTAAQLRRLAERYLDETRLYRVSARVRFIDKMSNNFLHIGLIHLMFPRASIIDARRHPLACCFSCFKQHFGQGQLFTYDLRQLGRYYRDYIALLAHFDAVLPGRIHRVYYERVVADLETEVRALLDHCRLQFEGGCMQFHQNRRTVQTASSEQVRTPIFTDGVDHWRHFDPWLDPLREALGDAVEQYPAGLHTGAVT